MTKFKDLELFFRKLFKSVVRLFVSASAHVKKASILFKEFLIASWDYFLDLLGKRSSFTASRATRDFDLPEKNLSFQAFTVINTRLIRAPNI